MTERIFSRARLLLITIGIATTMEKKRTKRNELGSLKPKPRYGALVNWAGSLTTGQISYSDLYDSMDVSFMNPFFAQIYFPHRRPETPFYHVHRQGFSYELRGGEHGLPAGSYPRLILLDLFRRSVLQQSRFIQLGTTVKDYLNSLGLDDKPQTSEAVHSTLLQMMKTTITISQTAKQRKMFDINRATGVLVEKYENFVFIENMDIWIEEDDEEKKPRYRTRTIALSPKFYSYILAQSKMPFDFRYFSQLAKTKNTLAFDLLLWLPYRVTLPKVTCRPRLDITIQQLHDQFDPYSPAPLKKFKERLRKSLLLIFAIIPDLSKLISFSDDGKSLQIENKPLNYLK